MSIALALTELCVFSLSVSLSVCVSRRLSRQKRIFFASSEQIVHAWSSRQPATPPRSSPSLSLSFSLSLFFFFFLSLSLSLSSPSLLSLSLLSSPSPPLPLSLLIDS